MSGQGNVLQRRPMHGVDDGERAVAISNQEMPAARVKTDIVGIVLELETPPGEKIASAEELDQAALRFRNRNQISAGDIGDALGFAQSGEAVKQSAALNIDHVERAVAEFGDEQSAALQVDRHVIDAPANIRELDFPFQDQRLARKCRANTRDKHEAA